MKKMTMVAIAILALIFVIGTCSAASSCSVCGTVKPTPTIPPIIYKSCGPANGGTFASQPSTSLLCADGYRAGIIGEQKINGYTVLFWGCNPYSTRGGKTPSVCSCRIGTEKPVAINGVCGSAIQSMIMPGLPAPTQNLCTSGTNSKVVKKTDRYGFSWYEWGCLGQNGGTSCICKTRGVR